MCSAKGGKLRAKYGDVLTVSSLGTVWEEPSSSSACATRISRANRAGSFHGASEKPSRARARRRKESGPEFFPQASAFSFTSRLMYGKVIFRGRRSENDAMSKCCSLPCGLPRDAGQIESESRWGLKQYENWAPVSARSFVRGGMMAASGMDITCRRFEHLPALLVLFSAGFTYMRRVTRLRGDGHTEKGGGQVALPVSSCDDRYLYLFPGFESPNSAFAFWYRWCQFLRRSRCCADRPEAPFWRSRFI